MDGHSRAVVLRGSAFHASHLRMTEKGRRMWHGENRYVACCGVI
jgi:hypothetical protein